MKPSRAVVFVDHQSALLQPLGSDQPGHHTLHAHHHETRQHASRVRTEHAFFGEVCAALDAFSGVLVTGGHQGLADFRHYVQKHHPTTALHIAGYEVVDHPSVAELVALARIFFTRQDRMAGIAGTP